MKICSSAYSDIGPIRSENQDRWFADDQLGLFIVADGIGGGPHGAVAAEIVIQVLPALIRRWLGTESRDDELVSVNANIEKQLKKNLTQVSEQLRDDSHHVLGLDGMGSTAAVLAVTGDRIVLGHLGDSRVYRLRDGRLCQLTVDHSMVQVLISAGELSADDVAGHPTCTRLTRFVGMPSPTLPTISTHTVQAGDRLLLCTDGVSGAMPTSMVPPLLNVQDTAEVAVERLVLSAVEHGGEDNATAIVVDVKNDPECPDSAADSSSFSGEGAVNA